MTPPTGVIARCSAATWFTRPFFRISSRRASSAAVRERAAPRKERAAKRMTRTAQQRTGFRGERADTSDDMVILPRGLRSVSFLRRDRGDVELRQHDRDPGEVQ